MSSAGAVMLKMLKMVNVLPMPIMLRQLQKITTSQTELMGVFVTVLTLAQKLSHISLALTDRIKAATYSENVKAASRAKAQAILEFANIAEQPVKHCTRMTKNHMMVPPVLPPAFKKICATGSPVGVAMMPSKSDMQKQNVTVSIQPTTPDTRMAALIATGPRMAASCVSSDMLRNRCKRC